MVKYKTVAITSSAQTLIANPAKMLNLSSGKRRSACQSPLVNIFPSQSESNMARVDWACTNNYRQVTHILLLPGCSRPPPEGAACAGVMLDEEIQPLVRELFPYPCHFLVPAAYLGVGGVGCGNPALGRALAKLPYFLHCGGFSDTS